jgi:hypothetical protein
VPVLLSPLTGIENVVVERIDTEVKETVRVVPESETLGLMSRDAGLIVPSVGLPDVPGGTVMVIDVIADSPPCTVNPYV